MMAVRPFDSADTEMIQSWWKGHGVEPPAAETFSPTGAVVMLDDEPVAASFCYSTSSCVAIVAFTVTNPLLLGRPSVRAIEMAIKAATAKAREIVGAAGIIWHFTQNDTVHWMAKRRAGFNEGGPAHTAWIAIGGVAPDFISE